MKKQIRFQTVYVPKDEHLREMFYYQAKIDPPISNILHKLIAFDLNRRGIITDEQLALVLNTKKLKANRKATPKVGQNYSMYFPKNLAWLRISMNEAVVSGLIPTTGTRPQSPAKYIWDLLYRHHAQVLENIEIKRQHKITTVLNEVRATIDQWANASLTAPRALELIKNLIGPAFKDS
jgi:hypothetical protein